MLYASVGATLVAKVSDPRLKSLLHLIREIYFGPA